MANYLHSAIVAGMITGAAGFVFAGGEVPAASLAHKAADPTVFNNKCLGCHSVLKDNNGTGPSLFEVVGRLAGTLASFKDGGGQSRYSAAMRAAGQPPNNISWTEANLKSFMADFAGFIPNTNMQGVPAVSSASDRQQIVDYLKEQVGNVEPPLGLGKLIFQSNTPCYYRNYLFGKNVKAAYSLFNESAVPPLRLEGPFVIDGSGLFSRDATGYGLSEFAEAGALSVRVNCDGRLYNFGLTDVKYTDRNVVLSNAVPSIRIARAELTDGRVVQGVPKGSTVTLVARATDPDGSPTQFSWRVTAGVLSALSGSRVRWTLPNNRGLHFAYVLASDAKGGYREATVTLSTDAGIVLAPPAVASAPPPQLPFGRLPDTDHFLTFFSTQNLNTYRGRGADSRMGSCRYYVAIGAATGCAADGTVIGAVRFLQWLKRWDFDTQPGTNAIYANVADLDLQRDMHGKRNAFGAAFYVCNHPNVGDRDLTNTIDNKKLVACVAMEYAPLQIGGQKITKFLTFGPTGALLQSVNLDGRGEKFVPGSCVVCHGANRNSQYFQGGGRFSEFAGMSPDLGALFLPFDPDNFVFSRRAGLTFDNQREAIFQLNKLVRDIDGELAATGPAGTQGNAVVELINGWYPGGTSVPFNRTFVPTGWAGRGTLYLELVKPSCRTCHVAMTTSFNTFNSFAAQAANIANYVCGNRSTGRDETRYAMPNALTAFNRFWDDAQQVAHMVAFLHANGQPTATCNPP